MDAKEDVYIQLLKLAREDLRTSTGKSVPQIKDRLRILGIQDENLCIQLFGSIYNKLNPEISSVNSNFMSMDAYLKLLAYEELKHSLEESQQARKEARTAIMIAIGAVLIQISTWILDTWVLPPKF
jgi:hypothetical protein